MRRRPFGILPSRWPAFVVPPLIAILIGMAVAVASSPALLTRGYLGLGGTFSGGTSRSPASSSSLPSGTSPGVLGSGAHLVVGGSGVLIGLASNLVTESIDGGKTWASLPPPANASGIAVDPANPRHAITGGTTIRVTTNGGGSWKSTQTSPPGAGPYQPLQLSPFDSKVWFVIHRQRLFRTRDGAVTWREMTSLPTLSAPVMVPSKVSGQFFLTSGNRVFQLVDNGGSQGQQILELAALPRGVKVAELAVLPSFPLSLLARVGPGSAYLLKGNTWSVAGVGLGGPVAVADNGNLLVGNGGAKLRSPGAISYSTDAGATWSRATGLPSDQSVEAIAAQPNSTTLYAYCYGGDIYASTDSGHAWTLLSKALRTTSG
jgi:hypothetical protein